MVHARIVLALATLPLLFAAPASAGKKAPKPLKHLQSLVEESSGAGPLDKDAFKALRSGVPAAARTDELTDIVEWLGELVRQVDSSLLDEWEQLTSPDQPAGVTPEVRAAPPRPACLP